MAPYLLGFAAICGLLCYGLMQRPTWMWFVGLVVLYLSAGRMCLFFFDAVYSSETGGQLLRSLLYLAGGLLIWIPSTLWWFSMRGHFGKGGKQR